MQTNCNLNHKTDSWFHGDAGVQNLVELSMRRENDEKENFTVASVVAFNGNSFLQR